MTSQWTWTCPCCDTKNAPSEMACSFCSHPRYKVIDTAVFKPTPFDVYIDVIGPHIFLGKKNKKRLIYPGDEVQSVASFVTRLSKALKGIGLPVHVQTLSSPGDHV